MTVAPHSQIDRGISINAPVERVFRALTNAEELSAWFQVRIEGTLAADRDVLQHTPVRDGRRLEQQVGLGHRDERRLLPDRLPRLSEHVRREEHVRPVGQRLEVALE